MSLDLDTSRAFRFPEEVTRLVQAVVAALPEDESLWVEWKERLDLAKDEAFSHVPHTIVGLANRDPAVAARWAEGYGYLIVGAEPGNLAGTLPMDPADLREKVTAHIGDKIGWHPQYVLIDGKQVLVIAVDPPQDGDPIHCLRKQIRQYRPGHILTRLPGQTVMATPQHLEMLQKRLMASSARLDLSLHVDSPAVIEAAPDSTATIEDLVKRASHACTDTADAEDRRPYARRSALVNLPIQQSLRAALEITGRYQLSDEEYDAALDEYASAMRSALNERVAHLQKEHHRPPLQLSLTNATERPFLSVEVRVELTPAVKVPSGHWTSLPEPPKRIIERMHPALASLHSAGLVTPALLHYHAARSPTVSAAPRVRVSTSASAGSLLAEFAPVDVRPHSLLSLAALDVQALAAGVST